MNKKLNKMNYQTYKPKMALSIAFILALGLCQLVQAQTPTVTVRFANPEYACATGQYCLDVEFQADMDSVELFGMNVRFFYDDELMELDSFTDFQGGYDAVAPDPPTVLMSAPGVGYSFFGFGDPGTGVADFVNGAIQLVDDTQPPIYIDTAGWTYLFQVCFTLDSVPDSTSFCPPVVWDLEQDPANGGFLAGDDGVVMTVVDPTGMMMSIPADENVVQFNWQYVGTGTPPFGEPVEEICISLECIPEIVCPADITMDCGDSTDPENTGVATATEVCLSPVTITFSDTTTAIPGECVSEVVITRTWIATNECNISDTCVQLITVIDTTGPVLLCPPDVTIECDESTDPSNTGQAVATDACDPSPIVTYIDVTVAGSCPQEYTIDRIWIATDTCGNNNDILCRQTITVIDETPPVITCPVDLTLECSDPIPTDSATATDNCSSIIEYGFTDILCDNPVMGFTGLYDFSNWVILTPNGGSVTLMGDTEVMLEGPDGAVPCSTGASVLFQIVIPSTGQLVFDWNYTSFDVDGPFFDPFGYNLNGTFFQLTDDDGPLSQSGTATLSVTAGDVFAFEQNSIDCIFGQGATTVVEFFACIDDTSETCTQLVIRNHTATDECGNQSSCIQTIYIQDTTPPVITCPADTIIDCDASTSPDSTGTGFPIAIDNCDTTLLVEFTDSITPGECVLEYTITRVWTATDACGLSSSCQQIITVQDTTPPLITCPTDLTIECTDSTLPDSTGFASATDNCDTLPEITFSETIVPGSCPQEMTILRVWIATDTCGNSSTCLQTIQVIDTLPPVITCPVDVTIECTESTSPDNTGLASATDNCDTLPVITFIDSIAPGICPQEMTITRTWTATDACGNSSSCDQIISVIDTIPPAITCPADITIECDQTTSPELTGIASAIDNCDTAPLITSSDVTLAGSCPQEYTIQRTWTATDACGNSSSCLQIIGVEDNTPPVITCPEDVTLACTDTIPTDTATAVDNCSNFITYSFTDIMCDNPVQGFTGIYDFTNWTVILPPEGGSVTPMGDSEVMLVSPDDVTVCDDASVLFQIVIPSTGQLVFDWNYLTNDSDGPAFDPFGYNLNGTFFQLTDNGGPDAQSGTTTIVVTAGDVFAFEQQSTDCIFGAGATTVIEFFACIDDTADVCTQLIIRTHTAADECGNESSCVQTLFVVDTIAPTITCPLNVTLECVDSTLPDSTGFATATDNCDTLVDIVFVDDITISTECPENYTITRTWTATDNCGNSSSCVQVITVQDTTAPVITCPVDVTVECDDFVDIMVNGDFETMDFTGWTQINVGSGGITINDGTFIPPSGDGPYAPCEGGAGAVTFQGGPGVHTLYQDITIPATSISATLSWIDRLRNHWTAYVDPSQEFRVEVWNPADNSVLEQLFSTDPGDPLLSDCLQRSADLSSYIGQTIRIAFTQEDNFSFFEAHLDAVQVLVSDSAASTGIATAIDICDTNVWITYVDVVTPGACPQAMTIDRTWTASDNCGNSSTCVQTITVEDVTPPEITCPVDVTIECDADTSPDSNGSASATDNCDTIPLIASTDVTIAGSCAQEYTIERTWTATDACGNSSTCLQTITVQDNTPPVITCPEDVTLSCTDTIPSDTATAVDNCSNLITYSYTDIMCENPIQGFTGIYDFSNWITILPPEGGSVTLMGDSEVMLVSPDDITACDDASVLFQITITTTSQLVFDWNYLTNDIDGPSFDPFGYNLNGTFFQLTDDGGPDAQSGTTTVAVTAGDVFAFEQQSDDCIFGAGATTVVEFFACIDDTAEVCTQLIIRTHTAADECGNESSCVQTLFVVDSIAPIITCPVDLTIECDESTLPDSTGFATATDDCDTLPTITFADEIVAGSCPQESTINRTWTATDACGNSSTCLQVIVVDDNTPPVITCPPDTIILCTASTLPDSTGFATATDNCDTLPVITFSDVSVEGSCPQQYTITRTWVATDTCGNASSCNQIITIVDTIPPAITCPADVTIECDDDTSPDSNGSATATDNCDTIPLIASSDVTIAGSCPQEYTIERTWTATDACGNSSTCLQTISVQDNTPPVITCPEDVTLACTDTIPTDTATAVDNCSNLITYSFTDIMCDNPVQGFTGIYDFTNWTIILPPEGGSVTPMGDSEVMLVSPDDVTVCDDASVLFQIVIPSTGQLVFDWNYLTNDIDGPAFDPFGYNLNGTFFQLTDNGGTDAQSGTTTVAVTAGDVFAFEQQSTDCIFGAGATTVIEFFACVDDTADVCTQLIIRTHTAADECGNESSCVQTLFVIDSIAPTITCPVDLTINCDASTLPDSTGFATATDDCDTDITIDFVDVTLPGSCAESNTITRTWTATDNCGNSTSCIQLITVQDTTPPVITCPVDVTVECDAFEDIMVNGGFETMDFTGWTQINSGAGGIGINDGTLDPAGPDGPLPPCDGSSGMVTFQGGPGVHTLYQDVTIPAGSVSATLSWVDRIRNHAAFYDEHRQEFRVEIWDPSDNSVLEELFSTDPGDPLLNDCLQRAADLSAYIGQTIRIAFTEEDTFNFFNAHLDAVKLLVSPTTASTGVATATDNCDTNVWVTFTDIVTPGSCPQESTIDRTWTASDNCGNSSTCVQVITVEDNTPPLLTCPDDITLDCENANTSPDVTGIASATDNCDDQPIVDFSDVTIDDTCPEIIQRTWTATDACGNIDSCIQLITISDTTAPVIICPTDVTVTCASEVPPVLTGGVTVSDNCSFITVTHGGDIVTDSVCLNQFTIGRVYVATDECGNTATCIQAIVVFDDVPPMITCPPGVTVSCASQVPPVNTGSATATDNCAGPVTITHDGDVTTNMTCANRFTLTRTYRATDACGNSSTCTQVIIVFDSTPPMITCPANVTVSCANQVPPVNTASVITSDNCGGVVTVTHVGDATTNMTCANRFTLTRTYRATDVCGNSATCTQVITVFDNTPPVITCPPNITVAFGSDTSPTGTGFPTGSDNCGGTPTFTFTDVIIPGLCPEEFTINRTWTATDSCGLTATCLQVIFVDGDCIVDLSLTKTYIDAGPIEGGDDLLFIIEIENEGEVSIGSITITDYIPLGFSLNDPDWTPGTAGSTGQSASIILSIANGGLDANGLNPGEIVTVNILLIANEDVEPGCYENTAEITQVFDVNGVDVTDDDIDSQPDDIDTNDPPAEDDHDIAPLCVLPDVVIVGDGFVCPGELSTYSVLDFNPDWTYEWSLNGGGVIVADNGSDIQIQWQDEPGGPFTITLVVTLCDGCVASTTFIVFIQGIEEIACNDLVQISLGPDCQAVVQSGMILEGENEGNNNYFVIITDEFGNVIPDATLTGEHVGQCFTVTVVNECNDQSCWGTICVEDKIPPAIECTDVTVSCGTSLEPVFEPPVTGSVSETVISGLPIGPNAGTVTTQDIILDVPANAVVTDVNVTIDLDHTWSADLEVVLISPSGTVITLASAVCGSADNWENVTFDDQAGILVTNACNGTPPPALLAGSVIPQELLAPINGQTAVGTWVLQITDLANADGGTLNEVTLDVEYYLAVPSAPTASDACGEVTLTYTETQTGEDCEDLTITRIWTATDESGNTSTCVQVITVTPLTLDNVDFPPAFVGECGESILPDHTGWPTVNGTPITDENELCNIFVGYWDKELNECGGGRKIVRTWTILDWCTVEIVEAVQVIKLSDTEGPELTCPEDFEVGTDFWYCYANVSVPKPVAVDECSEIAIYQLITSSGIVVSFGNNFVINELGLGTHTVTWIVSDECGNSSSCSFEITVVDDVVPVANCDEHTIVSLTNDGPQGITLVPASVFDDGSYDNCGPVTFRARRMDSCIDIDWTTEGACIDHVPGGVPPINSRDRGTVHRPCVPFACCDVGAGPIMVELEVTDAAGNINYCMVEAVVQDKISPFIECPPDIIVSCDFWFNVEEGTFVDGEGNNDGSLDEDPLSAIFGNMFDAFAYNDDESVRQDIIINDPGNEDFSQPHFWGIDGWADDNCEVNLSVRVRIIDDCSGDDLPGNAPDGAVRLIERRFSASDGNDGNAPGTCTQRIWVVDYDPFYINDVTCNNADPNDGVIWPCDVVLTTCPEDLGNTGEPTLFDDACSLIGVTYEDTRFDFVDSACFKILREWKVIDWCQYDPQSGYGLWSYIQVIKVHDHEGPEFEEPCDDVVLCVADPGVSLPDNNQAFLGEDDPDASSCSAHLNLCRIVHETCSDFVTFDVKIYPNNGDDFWLVKPATTIAVDSNNNAELCFDTRNAPQLFIREDGIPYNSKWCGDYHRILWTVEDGCGNFSTCEYLFRLEDCKAPSPVCINGLSTVVMPVGGQVTIWAKDFDASSFDDCTPAENLLFSFSGDVYEPSFTYTCDNVPAFNVEIPVQIWVADEGTDDNCNDQISWAERNKDFCTTTIVIADNNNVCDSVGPILEGLILTEHTDAVAKVAVTLTSPGHFFPLYVTAVDGKYNFTPVPLGNDYTITPVRDDEHRNGVSTLDLVRIQKHLLGKEVFTSPYQYIAADANNSESVSAIDLVEIRKLILGIFTEFPANESWRFVEEGFQMNPENPWPFNEIITINDLADTSLTGNDFVGVKVGDVNNTAQANATQILPRNGRRVLNVIMESDLAIESGDVVDVKLRFPEKIDGFQWTFKTNGLKYEGVSSETMEINDSHIGLIRDGVITMSWNVNGTEASEADQVIHLHFTATSSGDLENMIQLTSLITEAEAYTPDGEILDVKLGHNYVAPEFALYQNNPNPWNSQTTIGFDLPTDADVTFSVFDVDGKTIKTIEGEYKAGYNTIMLNVENLPGTGVMYYRLESGEYSATKKMVLIK